MSSVHIEEVVDAAEEPEYVAGAGGVKPGENADGKQPNFDFIWEEYENHIRMQKEYDEQGVDVHPESAFVIKTTSSHQSTQKPMKVFINVCHSELIDPPSTVPGPDGAEQLRVPLSCGPVRNDTDKEGESCLVVDVVFNSDAVSQCRTDEEFRNLLADFSAQNLDQKHKLVLSRDFKYPKLRYKAVGGVVKPPPHRIRKAPKKDEKPSEGASKADAAAPKVAPLEKLFPTPPASTASAKSSDKPLISEVESSVEVIPNYKLFAEYDLDGSTKRVECVDQKIEGAPQRLVYVVELPDVGSIEEVDVSLSDKDFVLSTAASAQARDDASPYSLQVAFPAFAVGAHTASAAFKKKRKELNITLAITPRAVVDTQNDASSTNVPARTHEAPLTEKQSAQQAKVDTIQFSSSLIYELCL